MKPFDKVCLIVGKVVVAFLTFLSCFYALQMLFNAAEPYISGLLNFLAVNKVVVTMVAFGVVLILYGSLYIIQRFSGENKLGFRKKKPEDEDFTVVDEDEEAIDLDKEEK